MREHDRNNGVNPKKRGQMNRQKNRELTGWEENSSVSFLYGHLTLVMMDIKDRTFILAFLNKLSNTENLSL